MRTQLLSKGDYALLLTNVGAGYSQWRGLAVTRWRSDATCDADGSFLLLRDDDGAVWSPTLQPFAVMPDAYEVDFSEVAARFVRRDGTLTATTNVVVSAQADGEVRQLSLHNDGDKSRTIEVTSCAELVLAAAAGDAAHPAFSKLFVQTEYLADVQCLLATRRRRSPDEPECWAAHVLVAQGDAIGELQWETDRARFIGRDRTLRTAAALDGGRLSGTVGTVLDPVFALRRSVEVAPGQTATLAFWTVVADSRAAVLSAVDRCLAPDAMDQAHRAAESNAAVLLHNVGIDNAQASVCQQLAAAVLYLADPALRPSPDELLQGVGGAPNLWPCGISGDHPIVLVNIAAAGAMELVSSLLRAHAYLTARHVAVDLVIRNTAGTDTQVLHSSLQTLIAAIQPSVGDKPKSVFLLEDAQLGAATRNALVTVACVQLHGGRGSLAAQLARTTEPVQASSTARPPVFASSGEQSMAPELEFDNGYGGFADDGREFVTALRDGATTPMPWSNVIANPEFGCITTASGSGYTWSGNSQKNTLTPWGNDPVTDAPVEAIYLRDEDSGALWTPTALPIRDEGDYIAHHGKGYSRFVHRANGIESELLQFVPVVDAIRISRLRLCNRSGRERRLSITGYVQWKLGANGADTAPYVVTSVDADSGALLARNPWREDFGQCVAFLDLRGLQSSLTGDRTEFLGRHGAMSAPAALLRGTPLSGRVGAGIDPCGALQTQVTLAPGQTSEIVVLLGQGADHAAVQGLIAQYRNADLDVALSDVKTQWDELLGAVQVHTPDRALDLMLNHWLLYQVTACRLWARTAFYQSSGAYGFRDQLQDVMALCVARPDLAREHILRAASRQFCEGDVQHWWLPPSGAGIRTRMTDDRLWLPYVANHYLTVSGNTAVLDEEVPFLHGAPLQPEQMDAYFSPTRTTTSASLYEHCARAIDVSLAVGAHGLPLMGTGDWNDGMNRVGELGRGESNWLGWFLIATIDAFLPHARARGDHERAQRWNDCARQVRDALEDAGWDGGWYRRGYYDDGTALGSRQSAQCKIDTIAQSWSVIAGTENVAHATQAMAAVQQHLIREEDQVALLFTPPFDHPHEDPGYIQAYPPGLRENGGQYTHGAAWSIFAFAMLGEGDQAGALFDLINPLSHALNAEAITRYKVEPYVVCADVYSVDPHVGRGGWTWYTGSAAWLYRAGLEAILGFRLQGDQLLIDPCIPGAWPGFSILYRFGRTRYTIDVRNPHGAQRGVASMQLDGVALHASPCMVPLHDDGNEHRVDVVLGHAVLGHAASGHPMPDAA